MKERKLWACLLMVGFACTVRVAAEIKAPYLRLSFDRAFQIDGAGVTKLTRFAGSPYGGIAKAPAGKFTEGISGQAFIPDETLAIQGEGVFPAPEGTLSIWIKPVRYKEDWSGGPLLTPGRIGAFLTGVMHDEKSSGKCSLQVRLMHDCWGGMHWSEDWPEQGFYTSNWSDLLPFTVWQEGKWRMLTVVWSQGERRVYFDGVLIQHGTGVKRNPTKPGDSLSIPAGSKAVDEFMVWDTPLTDGQVAALFFSQLPKSGLNGAAQAVPRLAAAPDIGKAGHDAAWEKAVRAGSWTDAFSGMATAAKDTLELGHKDGYLFIRYREPMPKDYIAVKTVIGGAMLKRSVTGRDGNVWADDCVEARLTGDGGRTNQVFAVSASGALYDARNGDAKFDASPADWVVHQEAGEKFWTVEMRINLAALTGGQAPRELGFNWVRTVRQQGFARRQWSFNAGDVNGYGRLALSLKEAPPLTADLDWSEATGKLAVAVRGQAETPVTVSSSIVPLGHADALPEEKEINAIIQAKGRKLPAAVKSEQRLPPGAADWRGTLDYAGKGVALASAAVKTDAGTELARRAFLICGNELVATRIFNLPSRRELVMQVFLASEALAGADVVADIAILPEGKTAPVRRTTIDGFSGIMKEVVMNVADVKAGPYLVAVTVTKRGELLGKTQSRWFKSGDPEWLGNEIGIIKSVPAPWTPVKKAGDSIEVWGRVHSFAGSLLPAAVRVLDEDILAGPMRLIIKTADETIDTAKAETPAMVVDPAGVGATITGKARGKNLLVDMRGELEFDGFARFRFTLTPVQGSGPVAVESILFEVPFKKKYAELYDDSSYDLFGTQSGRIPATGMDLAGTGTARVGDTSRGVQFYPFFGPVGTRATAKPLRFIPAAESMVMRYVISEGVTLQGPVSTELGIIGTPVKPYDAKRIRLTRHGADIQAPADATGPKANPDLYEKGYSGATYWNPDWTNFKGASEPESGYYNYSPEWCAGLAVSKKKEWTENRIYPLLKIQPGLITARSPEYAYFYKEWGGQYYAFLDEYARDLSRYRGAETRPPGDWTAVAWNNRSYQDFYFYSLDKVLAAFAAAGVRAGVFVDCTNRGDGDIKDYRQWMQRLYQIVREHSPDGLIAIHMSGDRRMAIWSMADVLLEGEQYTANWQAHMVNKPELTINDCYPAVLPLDRVRASYAATLWGPQEVFATQFSFPDARQKEEPYFKESKTAPSVCRRMRHATGLMLAHGVPFIVGNWVPSLGEFFWCGAKEDPWLKRARWGYDETVKFIPYWDSRGMFELETANPKDIVASAWLRPDGKLMAIVFNNTDAAVTVRLKVNVSKFPVALKKFSRAVDITSPVAVFNPAATQPDRYECRDDVVTVEMRPRDFRLLVFEE